MWYYKDSNMDHFIESNKEDLERGKKRQDNKRTGFKDTEDGDWPYKSSASENCEEKNN